jgi:hypothetical protein
MKSYECDLVGKHYYPGIKHLSVIMHAQHALDGHLPWRHMNSVAI